MLEISALQEHIDGCEEGDVKEHGMSLEGSFNEN
jgi:hypothetical protein